MFEKNDKNGISLENHYEEILIKNENKYKGLFMHKCEKGDLMEEFILNLYFDKIGTLPLSQNILFFSKETSPGKM